MVCCFKEQISQLRNISTVTKQVTCGHRHMITGTRNIVAFMTTLFQMYLEVLFSSSITYSQSEFIKYCPGFLRPLLLLAFYDSVIQNLSYLMLGQGICSNEDDIPICNYSPRVSVILTFELMIVHTCYCFICVSSLWLFFELHFMLVLENVFGQQNLKQLIIQVVFKVAFLS